MKNVIDGVNNNKDSSIFIFQIGNNLVKDISNNVNSKIAIFQSSTFNLDNEDTFCEFIDIVGQTIPIFISKLRDVIGSSNYKEFIAFLDKISAFKHEDTFDLTEVVLDIIEKRTLLTFEIENSLNSLSFTNEYNKVLNTAKIALEKYDFTYYQILLDKFIFIRSEQYLEFQNKADTLKNEIANSKYLKARGFNINLEYTEAFLAISDALNYNPSNQIYLELYVEYSYIVGKYKESLKVGLVLIRKVDKKDTEKSIKINRLLSQIYYIKTEYKKALVFSNNVKKIISNGNDYSDNDKALAIYQEGLLNYCLTNHNAAIKLYKEALDIAPKNSEIEGKLLNDLGLAFYREEYFYEGFIYCKKGFRVFQKNLPNNHPELGASLNSLGLILNKLYKHKLSIMLLEKSLNIFSQTLPKYHINKASVLNSIGRVYGRMGNFEYEIDYYNKSLEMLTKLEIPKNHLYFSNAYFNIGFSYGSVGKLAESIEFLEKSLAIRQEKLEKNHPSLTLTKNEIKKMKEQQEMHERTT